MVPNDHFCNGRTRRSPGLARPGVARLAETPCCTGRCLICVVWVPGAGACQEAPQTRGVQGRTEGLLARRTPGRDLRSRQSVTTDKVCWRAPSTKPPEEPASQSQPARACQKGHLVDIWGPGSQSPQKKCAGEPLQPDPPEAGRPASRSLNHFARGRNLCGAHRTNAICPVHTAQMQSMWCTPRE